MYILGINFGHGASACLLKNGKLISAIENEKLTRIKGQATFPFESINYLMDLHKLKYNQLQAITFGCNDISEFGYSITNLNKYLRNNSLISIIQGIFFDFYKFIFFRSNMSKFFKKIFLKSLKNRGFPLDKLNFYDHHECHAYSAFYPSPFNESFVLTADGKGDNKSLTFWEFKQNKKKQIYVNEALNSLGQIYQSITIFLGFKPNRHEGKITGLAGYGNHKKTASIFDKIFSSKHPFKNKLNTKKYLNNSYKYYVNDVIPKNFIKPRLVRLIGINTLSYIINYQRYLNYFNLNLKNQKKEDIAAGVQNLVEQSVINFLKNKLPKKPVNICLAGGLFANVKINQKIYELNNVKNIFVQPAMDDAGTAYGSALKYYVDNFKFTKNKCKLDTIYLGPSYDDEQIEKAIKNSKITNYTKEKNINMVIAEHLAKGLIVGRFNKSIEYGPRALGNRSILVNPMIDSNINENLNKRLKRTEFMPFAPSMLDTEAFEILKNYSGKEDASKYMTITYNVKDKYINKVSTAIHVDGTARPQVVTKKENLDFYKTLKNFQKLTGIGCLLNTSFNMHEEPIVCSPEDAIRAFKQNAIDVLAIGNFIIKKIE
jgi:carbamoyltransferase